MKGAVLEDLEQLDLCRRGNGADFIQENSAVPGNFKFTQLAFDGACERPLFMAEHFAFDQGIWNGAAVDLNKPLVFS